MRIREKRRKDISILQKISLDQRFFGYSSSSLFSHLILSNILIGSWFSLFPFFFSSHFILFLFFFFFLEKTLFLSRSKVPRTTFSISIYRVLGKYEKSGGGREVEVEVVVAMVVVVVVAEAAEAAEAAAATAVRPETKCRSSKLSAKFRVQSQLIYRAHYCQERGRTTGMEPPQRRVLQDGINCSN